MRLGGGVLVGRFGGGRLCHRRTLRKPKRGGISPCPQRYCSGATPPAGVVRGWRRWWSHVPCPTQHQHSWASYNVSRTAASSLTADGGRFRVLHLRVRAGCTRRSLFRFGAAEARGRGTVGLLETGSDNSVRCMLSLLPAAAYAAALAVLPPGPRAACGACVLPFVGAAAFLSAPWLSRFRIERGFRRTGVCCRCWWLFCFARVAR